MLKLKLTEKETDTLKTLANSYQGEALIEFLNKLISELSDINTLKGTDVNEIAVRKEVTSILRENILDRLRILRGEVAPPENNKEFV